MFLLLEEKWTLGINSFDQVGLPLGQENQKKSRKTKIKRQKLGKNGGFQKLSGKVRKSDNFKKNQIFPKPLNC